MVGDGAQRREAEGQVMSWFARNRIPKSWVFSYKGGLVSLPIAYFNIRNMTGAHGQQPSVINSLISAAVIGILIANFRRLSVWVSMVRHRINRHP